MGACVFPALTFGAVLDDAVSHRPRLGVVLHDLQDLGDARRAQAFVYHRRGT